MTTRHPAPRSWGGFKSGRGLSTAMPARMSREDRTSVLTAAVLCVAVMAALSVPSALAHGAERPHTCPWPVTDPAGGNDCPSTGAGPLLVRAYTDATGCLTQPVMWHVEIWLDENGNGRIDREAHADDPATGEDEGHVADHLVWWQNTGVGCFF